MLHQRLCPPVAFSGPLEAHGAAPSECCAAQPLEILHKDSAEVTSALNLAPCSIGAALQIEPLPCCPRRAREGTVQVHTATTFDGARRSGDVVFSRQVVCGRVPPDVTAQRPSDLA